MAVRTGGAGRGGCVRGMLHCSLPPKTSITPAQRPNESRWPLHRAQSAVQTVVELYTTTKMPPPTVSSPVVSRQPETKSNPVHTSTRAAKLRSEKMRRKPEAPPSAQLSPQQAAAPVVTAFAEAVGVEVIDSPPVKATDISALPMAVDAGAPPPPAAIAPNKAALHVLVEDSTGQVRLRDACLMAS